MLILSRDVEEELVIILEDEREITVKVVRATNNKTRLGIEAVRSIEVHRREVWEAIKAARAATAADGSRKSA